MFSAAALIICPTSASIAELSIPFAMDSVSHLFRAFSSARSVLRADGERKPSADVMQRLRAAYHVAALLAERDARAVVQDWFQGMNTQLDDVPPARLLRDGQLDAVGPQVHAAARAFASAG